MPVTFDGNFDGAQAAIDVPQRNACAGSAGGSRAATATIEVARSMAQAYHRISGTDALRPLW